MMLTRYSKKIARGFIIKFDAYTYRYPKVRAFLVKQINLYPSIKKRLKSLLIKNRFDVYTQSTRLSNVGKDDAINASRVYEALISSYDNNLVIKACLMQRKKDNGLNCERKSPLERWFY